MEFDVAGADPRRVQGPAPNASTLGMESKNGQGTAASTAFSEIGGRNIQPMTPAKPAKE